MGQTVLETALNELKHLFYCHSFFAGQVIYDIGSFGRIFVSYSSKGNPNWFLSVPPL